MNMLDCIARGAPSTCSDCFVTPQFQVLHTPAGYYIGTVCECGPYTRESGYFRKAEEAEAALLLSTYSPRC